MASLFKKDNSRFWYATWRHCERKPQRSTGVPIRGAIINGIKESPSQARSRAQAIADGYEAADKEGTHSVRVKATIKILAGEAVSDVPTIHDFLSNFPDRAKDKVSRSTTNNRKTAVTLFLNDLSPEKRSTEKVRFANLTNNNEEKIQRGRNPENPRRGKTGKQNNTEHLPGTQHHGTNLLPMA